MLLAWLRRQGSHKKALACGRALARMLNTQLRQLDGAAVAI